MQQFSREWNVSKLREDIRNIAESYHVVMTTKERAWKSVCNLYHSILQTLIQGKLHKYILTVFSEISTFGIYSDLF